MSHMRLSTDSPRSHHKWHYLVYLSNNTKNCCIYFFLKVGHSFSFRLLCLCVLNPNITKSQIVHSKSDNVITGRPIWVGKRWLGSVTGMACYRWSRVWGARCHRFKCWGNPLFEGVSIGWDRLETSCSVKVSKPQNDNGHFSPNPKCN